MKLRSHNLLTWVPHLFLFYKEKVFRKLFPIMSIITAYAIIIVYVDRIPGYFQNIVNPNLSQFHLIFSFILTIIISFRVNTSYSRWWEGRILWGAIVNNCRNLGLKFDVYIGLAKHPEFYSLLHKLPLIIKAHLRKDKKTLAAELESLGINDGVSQPVILVTKHMYRIINELRNCDKIRWEQYTAMDIHLANLLDLVGGCERIANTPVPPAFAVFVKQALLFYSLMFPFGWVDTFGYLIVPVMIMIVYILLGLEILSEELEDPFGIDDNGLRLDAISKNIANDIERIAGIAPPQPVEKP
jgi:ion channel-forming bestrophin family protein